MSQHENDDLPTPVWSGTFNLFGVEMRCHVLSNGQRLIEADSINTFVEKLNSGSAPEFSGPDIHAFARWQRGDYGHA